MTTSYLLIMMSLFSASEDGSELENRLTYCSEIRRSADRLDCYDSLTEFIQNATNKNSPEPSNSENKQRVGERESKPRSAQTQPSSNESFELNDRQKRKPSREASSKLREVTIVKATETRGEYYTIELSDGQIWRQTQKARMYINEDELPLQATIKRNFLGGYRLQLKVRNQSAAIERIK